MELSGREYWRGLPLPSPGAFPNPGIRPGSPASQAGSLLLSHQGGPTHSYFVVIPLSRHSAFNFGFVHNYEYIRVLQFQPECCMGTTLPQGTTAGGTYSYLSPCSLALLTQSSIIASFFFFPPGTQ